VLMRLESDQYYQSKRNVEAYIDEFKDLIDLSGYTDPIAIVLKFRRGLNPTTQDRITESGTDRPGDTDFNGWFKAARCLNLNRLANEAFHLASRCPPTHSASTPTTYAPPPRTPFSFIHSHPPTAVIPAAMHTPSRALPPDLSSFLTPFSLYSHSLFSFATYLLVVLVVTMTVMVTVM
jgi:hypothetical protein